MTLLLRNRRTGETIYGRLVLLACGQTLGERYELVEPRPPVVRGGHQPTGTSAPRNPPNAGPTGRVPA